jgi:hypothetical protein
MSRVSALVALLLLGLAPLACEHERTQAESWIGGEIPAGNGGLPAGEPAGANGGDGDDEDWGDQPFAIWMGQVEIQDGIYVAAFGEYIAVNVEVGEAFESCAARWTSVVVGEPMVGAMGCSACEFAVELEYGPAELELDLDCAGWGFDPASVEGTHISVGYAGGETLVWRDDVDGEWYAAGYAQFVDGVFYFEVDDG